MLAAFAITTGAVIWMVRTIDRVSRASWDTNSRASGGAGSAGSMSMGTSGTSQQGADVSGGPRDFEHTQISGVLARITALVPGEVKGSIGQVPVERRLPTMAFALQPSESLDSRVAPGPFRAEFTVPFSTALSREAQIGVEFEGGKVMISRRGEIILSDAAAAGQPRIALTTQPIRLLVDQDSLSITFESDGKQPCRVRALWKPVEATVPLPLPTANSPLLHDAAARGFANAQRFNCAACHVSGDRELQSMLTANAGPILGDIGSRVQPTWIRAWLSDPQAIKPGASMPHVHLSAEQREDLTHYLVSLGGPAEAASNANINADLANTGLVAYHTVGCFACHGALEQIDALPGGHPASPFQVIRTYESMGRPSYKTAIKPLAEFLRDPVKHWPSGRMPSLDLQPLEAEAIAAYLISRDAKSGPLPNAIDAGFTLDQSRVERGLAVFTSAGCANCHTLGPNRPAAQSTLAAKPLESLLSSAMMSGCVAAGTGAMGGAGDHVSTSPHFTMNDVERREIEAFLKSLPSRKTNNVPLDHLATNLTRLNCAACHAYHGELGPETAIAQYFSAIEEADLGDEGRVPPNLSDVGAKLNPQWFHDVLTASGRARPYLGARMPQFSEHNVGELPKRFASASGVWPMPDQGPALPSEYGEVGRQLVGAKAMNCIQCHNVAGKRSTGTPGPDLSQMAERLRYDAFSRWIHDPKLTRPGTRMPSFFVAGMSGFTDLLGGEAAKQVDAIWAYLSLGEFMPLPDGFVDPSSMTLQVTNEPVVFRSFIKGAGVRALAVGYPEQIHIAYDAEKCRLAEAWEGEFINAAGAWANRGGTETNPEKVRWTSPKDPVFVSASIAGGSSAEITTKFRGYRLDEQRRPVFIYELHAGEIEILVEEQPLPSRAEGKPRVIQRFTLEGPKGTKVILATGGREARGTSGDARDGFASVTLDDAGKAQFELEVTW